MSIIEIASAHIQFDKAYKMLINNECIDVLFTEIGKTKDNFSWIKGKANNKNYYFEYDNQYKFKIII